MKRIISLCIVLQVVCTSTLVAQPAIPVHFEKQTSWKQVLEKAKRENKYIFVDVWATWCSPCVYMNKKVFPVTGDFFNKHFINVKLQLDTTAKDDAQTKANYKLARLMRDQYEITSYPTFLFFDPNGNIVHRALGGIDSMGLMDLGHRALDEKKQYYTLKDAFEKGSNEDGLLIALYESANQAEDEKTMIAVAESYLSRQDDLYTPAALRFLRGLASIPKSPAVAFFLYNEERVDAVLGNGKAMDIAGRAFLQTSLLRLLYNDDYSPRTTVEWDEVRQRLQKELAVVDRGKITRLVEWLKANYAKGH